MIEFKGEISGKCKKFVLNRYKNTIFIIMLIVGLVFGAITVLVALHWKSIALVFLIVDFFPLICSLFPVSKETQRRNLPTRVFIDELDKCVVIQCENDERFHMFSKLKRVVDYGDFYDFEFHFPDRDLFAVCQKKLLTKGTFEEFEMLFEGKIERK